MVFVAENYAKGSYEPLVDRTRYWAAIIGTSDREGILPIVLYRLDDLDKIGIRNEDGRLLELPQQPEIALSAITAKLSIRAATDDEIKLHPGLDLVSNYVFRMVSRGYAHTPYAPGCDWEQSKQIYSEVLMAKDWAMRQVIKNPSSTLVIIE